MSKDERYIDTPENYAKEQKIADAKHAKHDAYVKDLHNKDRAMSNPQSKADIHLNAKEVMKSGRGHNGSFEFKVFGNRKGYKAGK